MRGSWRGSMQSSYHLWSLRRTPKNGPYSVTMYAQYVMYLTQYARYDIDEHWLGTS